MRARKSLYLFLSLAVVLGLAAFLIHTLLSGPASSVPPIGAAGIAGPAPGASPASNTANEETATEVPLLDEGSGRASATEPKLASGDRTENFALAGARELLVRVTYPAGTPATEKPTVWLMARNSSEAVDPRELEMLKQMDPEDLVRATQSLQDMDDEDRASFWSRRPLDAGHQARMPFPREAQHLVVYLEGDYLYLPELEVLAAATVSDELTLEPLLGGRVHGHCAFPAGVERRDVDPHHVSGRVRLNGMLMRGGGGSPRDYERRFDLSPTGEFEARALPPDVSLVFEVEVDNLLSEQRMEFFKLAPGELREMEARFQLGSSIRGRVVDPKGKAVANASVWSEGGERGPFGGRGGRSQSTDEQGRFALQGITSGEHTVHAQAPGWKATESAAITLGEEQDVTDVTVTLETGERIAGSVRWPDQSPAVGAAVQLSQTYGQRGYRWRNTIDTQVSGEDGSFAFSGLSDGAYSLEVSAHKESGPHAESAGTESEKTQSTPSHQAHMDPVAAGAEDLVLELQETLGVAGRVVDDLGQPLPAFQVSASVSAEGETAVQNDRSSSQAFEAADGHFALSGLYPGQWKLTASAAGHHMADEGVLVVVPQVEPAVEIRLARSASLSGIVQDPGGSPVAGAKVGPAQETSEQARLFGMQRNEEGLVVTDSSGRFTLEDLAAGVFVVEATAKNWAVSEPVTVDLVPGAAVEGLVVELRNGGTIVGDAFDESGEPFVGRQVTLGMAFMAMGMGGDPGQTTDSAGHFVFVHVDPGRYAVTLAPPQDAMLKLMNGMNNDGGEAAMIDLMSNVLTENVTVAEGQESYVRLGAQPKMPVRVYGKVMEAGAPLASGMVFGITEGHALMQGMKLSKIEDGQYEFTVDRPGAYTFGVQTDQSGAPLEFQVDVPEAESFEQDLVLPRGAISGRVFGPDGDPAPYAEVRLSLENSGFSLSLDTEGRSTDADGRYVADHLRPGVYTVRAGGGSRWGSDEGENPLGVEIVSGVRVEEDRTVEGIDLHLRSSGSIEGTVLDRSEKPVAGIAIFVRDERGLLLFSVSPVTSEANGHFSYKGVPPGRFTVSARGQGFAASDGPVVDVSKGETSEIEVHVDPATMLNVTVEDEKGDSMRASIQVLDERGHEVAGMYSQSGMESLMMEGLDSKKTRVGPLAPGKYEVRATAKDGRSSSKPVTLAGKEERNLRLKIRE
jgi:protocatechuate 3,4-dioxygenase beta subunit